MLIEEMTEKYWRVGLVVIGLFGSKEKLMQILGLASDKFYQNISEIRRFDEKLTPLFGYHKRMISKGVSRIFMEEDISSLSIIVDA
mgnify:CR=1 FL=1